MFFLLHKNLYALPSCTAGNFAGIPFCGLEIGRA